MLRCACNHGDLIPHFSHPLRSVGGREYYGVAKEKAAAREEYENRSNSGENVGLVESRGKELFQISLNTGPLQQASFVLEYQQLLVRYQSRYRLDLNINPGRIVDSVNVTITARESQGIVPSTVNKSDVISTKGISPAEVTVEYQPSRQDQLLVGTRGLSKDLFFEYDIVHPTDSGLGLVITDDGYFVQFFSPTGLPTLPVSIVFVIDVSGSMSGDKIRQARESLVTIINQLRDSDNIGIVLFESSVRLWKTSLVPIRVHRNEALTYAGGLVARGGTNLNEGVLRGVSLLQESSGSGHGRILVLLTDGQPTSGVTNPDSIVSNVITAVGRSGVSVNCLGFGDNLDYDLLERLSLNNNGVTRRIYTGSDAAEQLQGFYDQITSPILSSLLFNYSHLVEFSSKLSIPFLFAGGEIVVVGKFREDVSGNLIPVTVTAHGTTSQLTFRGTVDTMATSDYPVERLVAYQRILELLDSRFIEGTNKTTVEQEALELSLKYNFVTELTSLIVVESGNSTNSSTLVDGNGDGNPESEDVLFFGGPHLASVPRIIPGSAPCCSTVLSHPVQYLSIGSPLVAVIVVPVVFGVVGLCVCVVVVVCCVACVAHSRNKKKRAGEAVHLKKSAPDETAIRYIQLDKEGVLPLHEEEVVHSSGVAKEEGEGYPVQLSKPASELGPTGDHTQDPRLNSPDPPVTNHQPLHEEHCSLQSNESGDL
jgi:uncharacterized protein YegL